jgi:hypothetical protein
MRSVLLSVLMVFAFANLAHAQDHKFSLGGGLNFNMIDAESDLPSGIDEEVSATIALAGKLEFKINEEWAFRTGLWLQEKSAKYSFDTLGFEGDVTAHTIYLSVPLTAQYQIQKDIALFGGYIADIRINDYCKASGDVSSCTIDEDSKSIVHVATAGIAIQARDFLVFEFSYQRGLSDVYENELKIHSFQGMAFYKF